MAPIRVALIGLSASGGTSWASTAHLPYLLSSRGREKYQIVALCNSSVEAAKKAIADFKLPAETRAYGSPDHLAADQDIDLVVCNTRVDRHYETILPSVAAGKAVFCEWPLAHDITHVRELVDLSRQKGARTMIGTQGRLAPVAVKIREILESGSIGRIVSSEFRAFGGLNSRTKAPERASYFFDKRVGGNIFTIGFGHLVDLVQSVIGEARDVQSRLQIQRPDVEILDTSRALIRTDTSDVPDLITFNASLTPSGVTHSDATLTGSFRRGEPFSGEPPLVWTVNGEKGEIRLISPGGTTVNAFSEPAPIEIHDFASDTVSKIEWKWKDWQIELPVPARNIGSLYEAYAVGDESKYPTFEDALIRHEQLQSMLDRWEQSNPKHVNE